MKFLLVFHLIVGISITIPWLVLMKFKHPGTKFMVCWKTISNVLIVRPVFSPSIFYAFHLINWWTSSPTCCKHLFRFKYCTKYSTLILHCTFIIVGWWPITPIDDKFNMSAQCLDQIVPWGTMTPLQVGMSSGPIMRYPKRPLLSHWKHLMIGVVYTNVWDNIVNLHQDTYCMYGPNNTQ